MFVLLEHRTDEPSGMGSARGPSRIHWDFLIEVPGQERLATWRLADNPIGQAGAVTAERIGDHRRVYLTYEGEISGGRGRVRRIDRGEAALQTYAERELRAELRGGRLAGCYEIVVASAERLVFRPVSASAAQSSSSPG